ncbi:MAG: LytTR family transcriptional regulator DNA-binding domain-containing protein [Bacteroidia bacterium]|nr:LytTR family transcriptional regulator DNA-binding domain-containing protein [Bacteroidia bacterium]
MSSEEIQNIETIIRSLMAEALALKTSGEKQHHALRSPDKIELPDKDGRMKLYLVKNIIMIEGASQYIDVHFVKEHLPRKLSPAYSLGQWKEIFDELGFLKLHRSYIVNPKHIIDCDGSTYLLSLTDGHHFTIQKPYRNLFHYYFHGR